MEIVPPYFDQPVVPSSKPPFTSSSSGAAKERGMLICASDARSIMRTKRTITWEAFISGKGSLKAAYILAP